MDFNNYFQSYQDYFWQWEENGEVLSIPKGNTIAYKKAVSEMLEFLAPQGLPSFGSVLLVFIATNPNAKDSIYSLSKAFLYKNNLQDSTIAFLELLESVPQIYKGTKKKLLFQALFENCHNNISYHKSKRFLAEFSRDSWNKNVTIQKPYNLNVQYKDLRIFETLTKRFRSVNDIIKKIASLPDIQEDILLDEEDNINDSIGQKDIVEQLIENNKTFHIGALIKRIWGGLNIPFHNVLPSHQPFGGVSDLTNKGDFDKLLISEFANDDIIFLSRLANNEALYYHRETPPTNNNLKRFILIDVSLKNWGTPKAIAFAVMLAIAKHPKTDIDCEVFLLGERIHPISIESLDDIIDALQILEGSLHLAGGLELFIKEYGNTTNVEMILISSKDAINTTDVFKILSQSQSRLRYQIFVDAEGKIDVFKRLQNSQQHIQTLRLDIHAIWESEKKASKKQIIPQRSVENKYPILVKTPSSCKNLLLASDGSILLITSDKKIAKKYELDPLLAKGCEIINENIPLNGHEYEIGIDKQGKYVLLIYNSEYKEVILFNLSTSNSKTSVFKEYKSKPTQGFTFIKEEQLFYHYNHTGIWSISIDGIVTNLQVNLDTIKPIIDKRNEEIKLRLNKFNWGKNTLKNINSVFINEADCLVFNKHELILEQKSEHIILVANFKQRKVVANQVTRNEYIFEDGSQVFINSLGLITLQSSNASIPTIYIPSVLDHDLGLATNQYFTGNEYYFKYAKYDVILTQSGTERIKLISTIKELTNIGLSDAKNLMETVPQTILSQVNMAKAKEAQRKISLLGGVTEIIPTNPNEVELEKIKPKVFFENYIMPFTRHIEEHSR
ncbi:hypothetical protein GCM10027035_46810 [Emticicia sediminis]